MKTEGTWERCYGESEAIPKFLIKPSLSPIRLRGRYELPWSELFEVNFSAVVLAYLFDRYFSQASRVFEFGCGTGHNLTALAHQQPGKKLVGLDWSENAIKLVNNLNYDNIFGRQFDFFTPDESLDLISTDCVLTIGALEQVGKRWVNFLWFLLAKRPALCVHLEPVIEFYDENSLFDYLAISYHRKRGYLEGFLTGLRELEKQGYVRIIEARRLGFGSTYHEAYSIICWEPVC